MKATPFKNSAGLYASWSNWAVRKHVVQTFVQNQKNVWNYCVVRRRNDLLHYQARNMVYFRPDDPAIFRSFWSLSPLLREILIPDPENDPSIAKCYTWSPIPTLWSHSLCFWSRFQTKFRGLIPDPIYHVTRLSLWIVIMFVTRRHRIWGLANFNKLLISNLVYSFHFVYFISK